MSVRATAFQSRHVTAPPTRRLLRIGARTLHGLAARRRAARRHRDHLRELRQLGPHLKADIGVIERRPREPGVSF